MTINKKLIHFNTNANFSKENTAGNILGTSIVFVKDAKKIVTHSSEYPAVNWGNIDDKFISSRDAVAGDVCFYDSQRDKLVLVRAAKVNATDYPSSRFTPIGVVAVPGTHNVYGDLSCGVVSLKEMNCDTPDTGSINYSKIYWGQRGVDISSLPDFGEVVHCGTTNAAEISVVGYNYGSCIPGDNYSGSACPNDLNAKYYHNDSSIYAAPSPYLTDGSRNHEYYRIDPPASSANTLADFNGEINTLILTKEATTQSDWRTASTITNNGGIGYSPAACCCWRFYTNGTKQGDWYLPAGGELGYVPSRLKTINTSISKLISIFSSSYIVSLSSSEYWSSSEVSNITSSIVFMKDGGVGYRDKASGYYVRAFLRVKI